jgi:hypothetical protein
MFAAVFTSLFYPFFWSILLLAIATYLILCLIAAVLEVKEKKLLPHVCVGIITTHFVYGLSFLAGLIKREL